MGFPNYFPYFNQLPQLSGREGYSIFCNSDFDWGQDGLKLADYIREHNYIPFTNATVLLTLENDQIVLPTHQSVRDLASVHGIVAVSRCGTGPDGVPLANLTLLSNLTPIEAVGKTIFADQIP